MMAMQLDDDTLQRYYDGELSPIEERVVRARVQGDLEAQKRLRELARLSELFRVAATDMGESLDSDALFADIQAGIKRQAGLGFGERLRVVSSEWFEHKRALVIPLAVAGAVAAAALLTLATPATHAPEQLAEKSAHAPVSAPSMGAPAAPSVQGSHVENVDFGSNTGTVFEIESEGVATAVVWISDEEGAVP